MQPINQVIERNSDLFDSGNWLVVNAIDSDFFSLVPNTKLHALHQTLDTFIQCAGVNTAYTFDSRDVIANPTTLNVSHTDNLHTHCFAPFVVDGEYSNALVVMPKSKQQLLFLLDMCAARLVVGGSIYVVGENRSGIKSIHKQISIGSTTKIDSARHCVLLRIDIERENSKFDPLNYLKVNEYQAGDRQWLCAALPGVFSHDGLDKGTMLLINSLPKVLHGKVLDFACGAGVIASCMQKYMPNLQVELSDVSAIALFCAAHSLHANQQHGKLIAADGLQGQSNQYDAIISNPPFHTGLKTDYSIVTGFIQQSTQFLQKGGKLFIVANRFLPYAEQLSQHYELVNTIAQTNQFSVYQSA